MSTTTGTAAEPSEGGRYRSSVCDGDVDAYATPVWVFAAARATPTVEPSDAGGGVAVDGVVIADAVAPDDALVGLEELAAQPVSPTSVTEHSATAAARR
jgi:hypothetical protein